MSIIFGRRGSANGPGGGGGGAPAWWLSAVTGQVIAIAGGTGFGSTFQNGKRLTDVSLGYNPVNSSSGQQAIISSWSGACVNQAARHYIMNANGGHGDYTGNEGYRIDLTATVPSWLRWNDSTPNTHPGQTWGMLAEVAVHTVTCSGVGPYGPFAEYSLLNPTDYSAQDQTVQDNTLAVASVTGSAGAIFLTLNHNPGTGHTLAFGGNGVVVNGGYIYEDGRCRAMHTQSYQTYADGQIWYAYENAFASGGGGSTAAVFAYNYSDPGVQSALASGTPIPWTFDAGQWTNYGSMSGPVASDGSGAASFGCACFDRMGHRVFAFGGLGFDRTITYVWYVNTQGPSIGQGNSYILGGGNPYADFKWAVCCYDLGIMVASDSSANQRIIVFDLSNVGGAGWATAVTPTGAGYYGDVFGSYPAAGYFAANRSIGVGDPVNIGNTVYKLQVPAGSTYAALVAGTWSWSSTTYGGSSITFDAAETKPLNKFNIIEDMGDGRAALIYCGGVNNPTYVLPVSAAGL